MVQAEASETDDGIARVDFLRNGAIVESRVAEPFEITWTNVPPGIYTLEARITDRAGYTNASDPMVVEFRPNAPPTFTIGPAPTVPEDAGPVELTGWVTGISPGAAHESGQALQFFIENENPALFSVPPALDVSGKLSFVPAPDMHGSAVVLVQLRDDGGTAFNGSDMSPVQSFVITVHAVNDRPTAHPAVITTFEDTMAQIGLSGSDLEGDSLTYLVVSPPQHGALSILGNQWTYVPNVNFFGADAFSFAVSDGLLQSEPAVVTIEVRPTNDTPHVVVSVAPLVELFGEAFVVSLNGIDAAVMLDASASSDIDNDPLQFFWFAGDDSAPFASGPIVTNVFPVGTHNLKVVATDASESVTHAFQFDVITLGDTVEGLISGVEDSALARQRKRPLVATLKAAAASFDRGNYQAALNQLQAFEQKVSAQVAPLAPALGREWLRIADAIALLAERH